MKSTVFLLLLEDSANGSDDDPVFDFVNLGVEWLFEIVGLVIEVQLADVFTCFDDGLPFAFTPPDVVALAFAKIESI